MNKISDFDKSFQHRVAEAFRTLTFPKFKCYKGFNLQVSEKDFLSYLRLTFVNRAYVPFSKWAYKNNNFDLFSYLSLRPKPSFFSTIYKLLRSWLKFNLLHVLAINSKQQKLSGKVNFLLLLSGFEDYLFPENHHLFNYLNELCKDDKDLLTPKNIFILCNKELTFSFKSTQFILTPNLGTLAKKNISLKNIILSFIETNKLGIYLLMTILKDKSLVDQFDEFLRSPLYSYGINYHMKEIVLTNSLLSAPPLFVYFSNTRPHKTSSLWYSADFFSYRYSIDDSYILPVHSKYFRVDRHYFWTEMQERMYEHANYESEVIHIPPVILQRNSSSEKISLTPGTIEICLFNIIPYTREHMSNVGYPYDHYINLERCLLFLTDICKVVKELKNETGINIKVYLKQKRAGNRFHAGEYLKTVLDLEKNNEIELLEHNTDLLCLLKHTTLSISHPFSTPFFIAKELKKDAFFYDPTSELLPCQTLSESEFLQGRIQLKKMIAGYIYPNNKLGRNE